jgi:hypothetical protein
MPNPRYLTNEGEPTVELLQKLSLAKGIYLNNLPEFCDRHFFDVSDFLDIQNVFLIGSHAEKRGWNNDTSDLDFKIVNPTVIPEHAWKYKRDVLDPMLKIGEKRRWVDLFFAREIYQVIEPKWSLIKYWNKDI